MDINVIRVEMHKSAQYGDKKILHVDDGTKWNVAQKKPFYDKVTGPGLYSIDVAEFQGKPYIKSLYPKNVAGAPAAVKSTTVKNTSYEAGLEKRLDADKKKQDDIRLEFYCGLVKDVAIANKQGKELIDLDKIQEEAFRLFKMHSALLEMAQAQGNTSKTSLMPTAQQCEAELAKAKEAEEEPPF
jgi:hypothetical protein